MTESTYNDLEAVLEILAEDERADLDEKHGQHILGMVEDTPERREAENRDLLNVLHQPGETNERKPA